MFGRKKYYHPKDMHKHMPKGYYPFPQRKSSSGIFFLLLILVGVYFAQDKFDSILPPSETLPFWIIALVIIALFFLFRRKEHY
ncbi:hypothetical protein CL617_01615 [archaeon]|nr:hypothetical protein [archaeon]|tara:strand:+ start:1738 stop:1986 length:249 start_codon:yes stop_codon:yes gene_type:complete